MEITILGQKLRLEILILILIVGILIGCNVVCQSCGGMSEAFTLMGSSLDYRMGAGVQNSFEQGGIIVATSNRNTHESICLEIKKIIEENEIYPL